MKRACLVLALGACAAEPTRPDYTGQTRRYVVDSIAVPTHQSEARAFGADLDDDGAIDNQLGMVIGTLAGFGDVTVHPDDMVASGVIASAVELVADDLDDDDTVGLRFLGADGDTAELVGGALAGGRFTTEWSGTGAAHLPVFMDADPTVLPLTHMHATLVSDGTGGFDATIQGAVPAELAKAAALVGVQQMFASRPADHVAFLRMFDGPPYDYLLSEDEFVSNPLIESLLAPDVELDGTRLLSIGFHVHLSPCEDDRCAPAAEPTCFDRARNGDETDVDCGGSCGGCAAGATCTAASDCQTASCDGTCAAPSCSDGVHDGVETDVDCGSTCGGCAVGQACWSSADCLGHQCGAPCTGTFCDTYTLDTCR